MDSGSAQSGTSASAPPATTARRTPIYDGGRLRPGDRVTGEAIIEFIDTTIVLRQGQRATVDARSSIVIEPVGEFK